MRRIYRPVTLSISPISGDLFSARLTWLRAVLGSEFAAPPVFAASHGVVCLLVVAPFIPLRTTTVSLEMLWLLVIGGALCLVVLALLVARRLRGAGQRRPTRSAEPTGPFLEAVGLPGEPRRFALLPEGTAVGRAADNDIVITEDLPGWQSASRHHVQIHRQGEMWVVRDLDSMNGVYVNGKRTGRNLLRDGWRIDVGGVRFVFHAGPGEA